MKKFWLDGNLKDVNQLAFTTTTTATTTTRKSATAVTGAVAVANG